MYKNVERLIICFLILFFSIWSTTIFGEKSNMSNQLTDIRNKIKELCADRYRSPDDFIDFAIYYLSQDGKYFLESY